MPPFLIYTQYPFQRNLFSNSSNSPKHLSPKTRALYLKFSGYFSVIIILVPSTVFDVEMSLFLEIFCSFGYPSTLVTRNSISLSFPGVPQDSVLHFQLGKILVHSHGFNYHRYAKDSKIYISIQVLSP